MQSTTTISTIDAARICSPARGAAPLAVDRHVQHLFAYPSARRSRTPIRVRIQRSNIGRFEETTMREIKLDDIVRGLTTFRGSRTHDNVADWLDGLEYFQRIYRVCNREMVRLAVLLLRSRAVVWLHTLQLDDTALSWEVFKLLITQRFSVALVEPRPRQRGEHRLTYVESVIAAYNYRDVDRDTLVPYLVRGLRDEQFMLSVLDKPIRTADELTDRLLWYEDVERGGSSGGSEENLDVTALLPDWHTGVRDPEFV